MKISANFTVQGNRMKRCKIVALIILSMIMEINFIETKDNQSPSKINNLLAHKTHIVIKSYVKTGDNKYELKDIDDKNIDEYGKNNASINIFSDSIVKKIKNDNIDTIVLDIQNAEDTNSPNGIFYPSDQTIKIPSDRNYKSNSPNGLSIARYGKIYNITVDIDGTLMVTEKDQ
jgi:hypothetical protein